MKPKTKNILIIMGILLLLILVNNPQQISDEKKEGFNIFSVGPILIAIFLIIGAFKIFAPGAALMTPAFAIGIGLLTIGGFNLFSKPATIPPIAYVVGFIIVLFMVLKKK